MLPQVHRWRLPKEAVTFSLGGSVRVDSGVREGDVVGLHYDPMIAKVLAFGPDRPSALAKLRGALAELQASFNNPPPPSHTTHPPPPPAPAPQRPPSKIMFSNATFFFAFATDRPAS